jgi:hypothetical protein
MPCSNPTISKEAVVIIDRYTHKMVSCGEWNKSLTDELQAASTWNNSLYLISEAGRIDRLIFD